MEAGEGSIYVNEEVKQRKTNPGRAVIWAVALLAIFYSLSQVGLQGAVSPARLQAHGISALVYTAQAIGGSGWAKLMALALALSVIGSTGTGIVFLARILYGMSARGTLPAFLGNISRRYSTPVPATLIAGVVLTGLTLLYLLTSSVQGAFNDLIAVTGLLYAGFYILTALAVIVYYRRRVVAGAWGLLSLGILPLGAAAFLGWVLVKSLQAAPAGQLWSVVGILAIGLALMVMARLALKSPFFRVEREKWTARH